MNVWEVRAPDGEGNWRICRVVAKDEKDAISLASQDDPSMLTAATSDPATVQVKVLGQDYGLDRGLKSYATESRPPCPTCGRPFVDELANITKVV